MFIVIMINRCFIYKKTYYFFMVKSKPHDKMGIQINYKN